MTGTRTGMLTGLTMNFGKRRNEDKGGIGQPGINEQKLKNCIKTINGRDADGFSDKPFDENDRGQKEVFGFNGTCTGMLQGMEKNLGNGRDTEQSMLGEKDENWEQQDKDHDMMG